MLKVNEIKSWAKNHGITVKKQGDGYVWFAEGDAPTDPKSIDQVATDIFNRITDGRFIKYQKEYAESRGKRMQPTEL